MKILKVFLTTLFCIYFVSCNNDEYESLINPSSTWIEMEGEGGIETIDFTEENWRIANVKNLNGDVNIAGDSYSIEGKLIQKNYTLSLESLGRMDALWGFKGFSIIRNTANSLEIDVKENMSGEDFNFAIILESGNEVKKIVVKQKKSQGYHFARIEYDLAEDDGDSIYTVQGTSYSFNNIQVPYETTITTIGGINGYTNSWFQSSEYDAFAWTENDTMMVKTPSGFWNNKVFTNGETARYTNLSNKSYFGFTGVTETLAIPAGNSKFYVEIQYRRRMVSYTLYLINNRTIEEKQIHGKWIELAPTGKYTVNWKE